jgi:hypothetical protein
MKKKKKVAKKKTKGYIFFPIYFDTGEGESVYDNIAEISDFSVIDIITSETRGISPDFRVKSFSCSICSEDFEDCSHEIGNDYNGKKCQPLMSDWEIMNFAIVSRPKHPKALISDVIIVEDDQGRIKYTWRGFRDFNENNRFNRIQMLQHNKTISEQAAQFFSRFFSINSEGTAVYPKPG